MGKFLTVNSAHLKDPTRTTTLRNAFAAEIRARFARFNIDLITSINKNDVFNLKKVPTFNPGRLFTNAPIPPGGLTGATDAERLAEFQAWMQLQINSGILEISTPIGISAIGAAVTALPITAPGQFMNTFITSGYNRGRERAIEELTKIGALDRTEVGIVRATLGQGVPANRVAQLQQQVFTELRGITAAMEQQIMRELSLGLINGDSPRTIAKALSQRVQKIGKTRATVLARTEIIRAHHLGNIDTLEAAGVEGVRVLAEWSTAGDNRVCKNCGALQGKIFTLKEIRGLIPLHPQCRCTAIPAGVGERVLDKDGNLVTKERNIEDIPKSQIKSTDKQVQAILDKAQRDDKDFKEFEKITILSNAVDDQQNTINRMLGFIGDSLNVKETYITNNHLGIAGPRGKEGDDGVDGDAGASGTGIALIEHIDRDILFYMTNGSGFRLVNVIPTIEPAKNGIDAVGLKAITCNANNEIVVQLTDDTLTTIGRFKDGEDGDDGKGIKNVFVKNERLFVEIDDGKIIDAGQILSQDEVVDRLTEIFEVPVGIVDAGINELGDLMIELSNGVSINTGRARGRMIDHEIDQGRQAIRFKKPSGRWGKWLILRRRGGGGGIGEAPIDGQQYARQDANWTVVTGGGSGTGLMPYRASEIPNGGLIPDGFAVISCGDFDLDDNLDLQGRFCFI